MPRLFIALAVGACFFVPGRALAASDADNLREGCTWLERAMAREPDRDDAFGMFMRGMKPKCQALLEGLARKDGSVRPDALKQVTKEINDLREIIDAEAGGPPPPLKEPSADEQVRQKVQAEKDAAAKEAADKAAAEKAEAERIAKEKAAAKEAEAQEAARKAAAAKAEQEARELAEREARAQTVAEKREAAEARKKAEREAAEARKQADREAKERAAAERKAAEEAKRQADREAKERAAAEREAARRAEEERKQAERLAREEAEAKRKAEAEAARLKAQALVDAETESEREALRQEQARREAEEAKKREEEEAQKRKAGATTAPRRTSGPLDGTWEQPESKVLDKYVKRTLNILTKDKKIEGEVYEEVWFPAPSSWIDRSCGGNDTFRMVTTARVSGAMEGGNLVLWRDAPRILTCTCSSRCTVETRRRGMDLAIGAGGAELSDSTGVFVRPGTAIVGGKAVTKAEVEAAQAVPVDFRGTWETASFKQRDRSVVQRLEISVGADGKVTGTLVERSTQALPLASWADRFCGGATKWDWVTQWQLEGKVKGRKAGIKATNGQSLLCTCPSKCSAPKEKLSLDLEMGLTGRTVEYEGITFERR